MVRRLSEGFRDRGCFAPWGGYHVGMADSTIPGNVTRDASAGLGFNMTRTTRTTRPDADASVARVSGNGNAQTVVAITAGAWRAANGATDPDGRVARFADDGAIVHVRLSAAATRAAAVTADADRAATIARAAAWTAARADRPGNTIGRVYDHAFAAVAGAKSPAAYRSDNKLRRPAVA